MQIIKKSFPKILPDNEYLYFAHLEGIIDSIDELSTMEITKTPTSYLFRLASSLPKYNEMLLQEILKFHNLFHIKLELSKSIKLSSRIVFSINLENKL